MKKRGRITAALAAVLIAAVCLARPAFAETVELQNGIEFEAPDGYTVLTAGNLKKNSETVAALGYGVDALQSKMGEKGIVMLAVDLDGGSQVQLQAAQTAFSKDVGDLTGLSDEEIREIGEKIVPGSFTAVDINDWPFYETFPEGGGGSSALVQYITFKSGILYTFSFYGDDKNEAGKLAGGLKVPAEKTPGNKSVGTAVLLWIVIVAAAVTVIAVVVSIVNEIAGGAEDNDVRRYIRIRRNKNKKTGIKHFYR